jgi:dystonin
VITLKKYKNLNSIFRDDFVDGILRNKFPSSRLEMNAVADKFDEGNGNIDWHKFMAALR